MFQFANTHLHFHNHGIYQQSICEMIYGEKGKTSRGIGRRLLEVFVRGSEIDMVMAFGQTHRFAHIPLCDQRKFN